LEATAHPEDKGEHKKVMGLAVKASFLGAFLLGIIYVGFCYVASFNSELLAGVPSGHILGTVAYSILGPFAGVVTSVAVALACLTTAIALASVFAEFLHQDILFGKISYRLSLFITLILTYFISILNFSVIIGFLGPILQICYPALIVLSVLNILYKLYDFKPVKVPFFLTLGITLLGYYWPTIANLFDK
jgi:LIVCS family branched-chain amino acid:cation transporter